MSSVSLYSPFVEASVDIYPVNYSINNFVGNLLKVVSTFSTTGIHNFSTGLSSLLEYMSKTSKSLRSQVAFPFNPGFLT